MWLYLHDWDSRERPDDPPRLTIRELRTRSVQTTTKNDLILIYYLSWFVSGVEKLYEQSKRLITCILS